MMQSSKDGPFLDQAIPKLKSLLLRCDQHCSAPTGRVVHLTLRTRKRYLCVATSILGQGTPFASNGTSPESPGPVGAVMKGAIRLEKSLVRCSARWTRTLTRRF